MAITFHNDSTVSLGSFIQVLASGRPVGRVFHVNNIYRFSAGDEAQRSDAELEDEDLETLKDKILATYRPDGGRA
jgi:hypothetical protein